MHHHERENPCGDIIEHDAGAIWKSFQLPYRRRLEDIKRSKKYKTGERSFPREGDGDERDQLAGYLVDDDELGVFASRRTRYPGGGGDADERDQERQGDGNWRPKRGGEELRERGPEQDGGG